ncbi:MAG TPA: ABC transporter ATP-binding protein [Deltaproteobacteria bacterium]|nr:ABC transporter ATP-binding protein [Deltaproteobacteria bacterium]
MAVHVHDVSFCYGPKQVLTNVTLHAPEARLCVLLGPNGSGKSTLLKVMAGAVRAVRGRVEFHGRDAAALRGEERARMIGYLPQFHQAVFPFTVEQVVLTGRAAYVAAMPKPDDREAALETIKTVGIEHLRARPYTELSGGERQLVMIARVLAQKPRIVLLDEPVSHLDIANQIRLLGLLHALTRSGITVLAVLHDPNTAMLYGDAFFFLKQGALMTPDHGTAPWEGDFLSRVYGACLESIPHRGKALFVPDMDNGGGPHGTA